MAEFTDTVLGKRLNAASGANAGTMTIATLGDSQGSATYLGGAIFYAMQRYYPCDATYDFRAFASGGQDFGISGSVIGGSSPRGFTLQATVDYPTRPADIAFVNAGYNDNSNAEVLFNEYVAGVEAIFDAGTQYVILMAPPPRDVSQNGWNRRIENYARSRANCFYIDTRTYLGNVSDIATGNDYNETPSSGIADLTGDGTHPTNYAQGLLAPAIADILRQIVRAKPPRLMSPIGNYNPATDPWANIAGPGVANNMGTSGVFHTTIPGTVAGIGAADRIEIYGLNGIATPSILTDANTGKRTQRITMSGASSSATMSLELPRNASGDATGGVAGRFYEGETVLRLTGVKNLGNVVARWTEDNGAGGFTQINVPAAYAFNGTFNERTERLVLRTPYPLAVPTVGGHPRLTVVGTFINTGEAHGGTIDHEHTVMQLVDL